MTGRVQKAYSAILLAAGSGSRMAADRNKIFLRLNDQAIFQYSLDLFLSDADCKQVILVGKDEEKVYFTDFLSDKVCFVVGGAERQDSVRHALTRVSETAVMIHDGARPFVTLSELNALKAHDNAILAVPVKDTIKQVNQAGQISQTVPRDKLWGAQTPQFFETSLIQKVHQIAQSKAFLGTDDASLVEVFSDVPVTIVPGSYDNIKITTPEDLIFGQAILTHRSEA
ncbi:2-C-methyl-D-erythritol 4-phosphate cytidylyltransferase [Bacilli bacterium]|nr:2-C-methyl-D-erythritol 4-phosphate cytidylyltransferase [Bacilli bacterium]GHU42623.1 2-C-methyl-D-erythritol 4-phosphate cytidylyltransferase [Bacilli bacterium]GHU45759.1 2-C-methyl-D-erythritol 4-phosphate cytidylyltransferase [Bacilli bacterium]